MATVRDSEEIRGVFAVTDKVGVSPASEIIHAIAADPANPGAFLTLGYAGWAAGQLDAEIESGSWIYLDIDEDVVFNVDPDERWQRCINSIGVDPNLIWMQPISE